MKESNSENAMADVQLGGDEPDQETNRDKDVGIMPALVADTSEAEASNKREDKPCTAEEEQASSQDDCQSGKPRGKTDILPKDGGSAQIIRRSARTVGLAEDSDSVSRKKLSGGAAGDRSSLDVSLEKSRMETARKPSAREIDPVLQQYVVDADPAVEKELESAIESTHNRRNINPDFDSPSALHVSPRKISFSGVREVTSPEANDSPFSIDAATSAPIAGSSQFSDVMPLQEPSAELDEDDLISLGESPTVSQSALGKKKATEGLVLEAYGAKIEMLCKKIGKVSSLQSYIKSLLIQGSGKWVYR